MPARLPPSPAFRLAFAAPPAFALVVATALIPARAQAARVLLVSDAGADLDIAAVLAADGHDVTTVPYDFATGNMALRADLAPYDAVFWSATGSGYGDVHSDPAVFANLAAFVAAGGRVLVTGYDSVASPGDPLLWELLGATGSTDVPPPPGPVSVSQNSLTTGRLDIRGLVPIPTSGDRDTLTGLMPDTIEVVGTTAGGGGAQWTLRSLGRGEIAYVSNGDSGATSSASWLTTSSGGEGAYNAAIRNFAAAADRGGARAAVEAHGSPRRARAMYLLASPTPAILVGPDRAWIPSGAEVPLAICAGPACHPVRETRECAPPECPGPGTLVVTSERIADVADFPRGRAEWTRELALCAADAELRTLAWAFGTHPEPAPPPPSLPRPARFLREERDWLGWELHASVGAGSLLGAGITIPQVSASIGLRFQPEMEEGLDVMYGTILGLDARVSVLPGVSGQRIDDLAILVGLAPAFSYAFPHDRVRIPPAWAWAVPGFGVAVRTDRAPTWYVDWHLEAAVLVDEHAGFDARLDLTLLDEWAPGDDVEAILSIGVGMFLR